MEAWRQPGSVLGTRAALLVVLWIRINSKHVLLVPIPMSIIGRLVQRSRLSCEANRECSSSPCTNEIISPYNVHSLDINLMDNGSPQTGPSIN